MMATFKARFRIVAGVLCLWAGVLLYPWTATKAGAGSGCSRSNDGRALPEDPIVIVFGANIGPEMPDHPGTSGSIPAAVEK